MNIPNVKPENISQPQAFVSRGVSKSPQKAIESKDKFTPHRETMIEVLKNQSHVRPEMLAKGKLLAEDPNYPSIDKLKDLANLFINQGKN